MDWIGNLDGDVVSARRVICSDLTELGLVGVKVKLIWALGPPYECHIAFFSLGRYLGTYLLHKGAWYPFWQLQMLECTVVNKADG